MVIIQENPSLKPDDDRISQLPDDILCTILSSLSLKEGAKMRLLSSKWKGLSPFTSNLRLDPLSILGIGICIDRDYMKIVRSHKSKFVTAVTQILKLYTGPKLDSFEVSFPLEDDSASNVDGWISFALEQAANRLIIDFGPRTGVESYYTFPFHLLPDGKASPLKHLSLKVCALSCVPDYAVKVHSLVTLYIGSTRINQVSLDNILSGCVNLEFLRIHLCYVPETCCITGALGRLKRLIIEECIDYGRIELNSLPELTTFEYMGPEKKFTLLGLPSLEKIYFRFINYSYVGATYVFNRLAKDVSHLQTLSFILAPMQEPPMPVSITPFKYLKNLELFILVAPNYDLLTIVHILNASPVLQKFLLSLYIYHNGKKASGVIDNKCIHFHLKEVEICGFSDRCNCMELAVYLLDSAVSLKRMLINSQGRKYHGVDRWTYDKVFPKNLNREVTHDLLQKHNVDSKVEIVVI
ncbi:unnamed protein product [Cuscuta epithymum]|uniref:F-box domain-containing protein n=1 Tax=Cuscuta epithymum TaxID=186058 RepID=A0AAV0FHD4_9ASTE|nr:unnamed protein product [Cuscuta epithymum]CAH9134732.1 unnamed protein product [Cuscuta epithymum]